jgi:hypothetical protein
MLPAAFGGAVLGTLTRVVRTERVHISHYTPWTGGANCARFVNGECLSKMSSGESWQDYVDRAAACPPEWDFGTRFSTPDGREWECLDRGGAIRYGYTPYWMEYDGLAWVDLLTSSPGYAFGQQVEIEFLE